MTYTLAPDSIKRAGAKSFARELKLAMATRRIGGPTLAKHLGRDNHSIVANYRAGLSLPRIDTARELAEALNWPKLLEIVARARTRECRNCGIEIITDTGGRERAFCSERCKTVHGKKTHVAPAQRQHHLAEAVRGRAHTPEELAEMTSVLYTDLGERGTREQLEHNGDSTAMASSIDVATALASYLGKGTARARQLIMQEAAGKEHIPQQRPVLCDIERHRTKCKMQRPSKRYPGSFQDCVCTTWEFATKEELLDAAGDAKNRKLGFDAEQALVDHKLIRIFTSAAKALPRLLQARPPIRTVARKAAAGRCDVCPRDIEPGDIIWFDRDFNRRWHEDCQYPGVQQLVED